MKAILVIDIDDSLIEGEERFAIDGYLMQESDCVGCYEAVGRITNAILKPMPEKKELANYLPFEDYPQQIRLREKRNEITISKKENGCCL